MSADVPSWREITTDDYAARNCPDTIEGAAWGASRASLDELLQGQQDGLYRLRLVLREAVEYRKRPNHHPLWLGHYDRGTDHLHRLRP